jgi:hypothetical protein
MSAGHDEAEPDACGPWGWTVEDAVRGVPTAPVAAAPLGAGAATLVRGGAQAWNGTAVGTPVLVPYSFAARDSSHYASHGATPSGGFVAGRSEAFDPAQRASVLQALAMWEQVSGLAFIEVPDSPDRWSGGIRFHLENLPAGTLGRAASLLPSGADVTLQRLLYADDPMQPGSEAFWALLHEIGHAVGLKHPFAETPVLPAVHDNNINTVMSYRDLGNHSQLGPYDIAAVQHLYGTQAAEETLAVRWSRGPGGALVSTGDGAANTITGLDIRDLVWGGGGADVIRTMGGRDDIRPGAGADTVWGGADLDTVWAETPRRHAALTQLGGAKDLALPSGRDLLVEVETVRFFDGQVGFHADLPAGQVFRLYGATLGRAPDPIGFGRWVQALETGAAGLADVAAGFAGSAEFAARYGAPDDAGFVALLYANVLGRAPDAAGLDHWLGAMAAGGTGRAGALLGFSESAEHKQRTAAAYHNGLWVPDPEAVDVLRAYVAVLDRLPDAGGLAGWTAAREAGLGQSDMVGRFFASGEFQARFGGLSNRDFVEQLYRTALDRAADPDGAAAWTRALDSQMDTRAGVVLAFANSPEMTAKLTPLVADGILIA